VGRSRLVGCGSVLEGQAHTFSVTANSNWGFPTYRELGSVYLLQRECLRTNSCAADRGPI